jgi:putative aldouronate transport system permease protein
MRMRRSPAEWVFDACNVLGMWALILITLYPFLYVLFASVSEPGRLVQHSGLMLWPLGFQTDAYLMVFDNPMILISYRNTLIYVVLGTTINIFLTSIGAYVLSRKNFLLRNPVMLFITFTMFFSGGLIPLYLQVQGLGLTDRIWAMVLPNAISVLNLIIMRTGFEAVPVSLEESAKLDGARHSTIMTRIVMPLSMPVIAVMILFYGVGHWNAWFGAMIYLRTRDLYPLQLILREILVSNMTDNMTTGAESGTKEALGEAIKYATIIVATLPVLFIYPFLQKYFVKGVLIGAIKE